MEIDNISFFSPDNNDFQFADADRSESEDQYDRFSTLKLHLSFWNPHVRNLGSLYGVLKLYVQDQLPEGSIEMRYRMLETSRRGAIPRSTNTREQHRKVINVSRLVRSNVKSNRIYKEIFTLKPPSTKTQIISGKSISSSKMKAQTIHLRSGMIDRSAENLTLIDSPLEATTQSAKQRSINHSTINKFESGQDKINYVKTNKFQIAPVSKFKANHSGSKEEPNDSIGSIDEFHLSVPKDAENDQLGKGGGILLPTQLTSQLDSVGKSDQKSDHTGNISNQEAGKLPAGQHPTLQQTILQVTGPRMSLLRTISKPKDDARQTILLEKTKEVFRLKSSVQKPGLLLLPFRIRLISDADSDSNVNKDNTLLYTTNDMFIFQNQFEADLAANRSPEAFELQISHMVKFAFIPKRQDQTEPSAGEFSSEAEFYLYPNLDRLQDRPYRNRVVMPVMRPLTSCFGTSDFRVDVYLNRSVIHENNSNASLILSFDPQLTEIYAYLEIRLVEVYRKAGDENSRRSQIVFERQLPTSSEFYQPNYNPLEFVYRLPIDLSQSLNLHSVKAS